ncbi:MAG: metallophosphoesterase family protein [Candidatus Hodarchaeota archaeon]
MVNHPLAIMSDIHGNSWALKAVLDDIQRRGIQKMINLGDTLYGPLDPIGTFQMLVDIDMVSIQGNEDRILWDSSEDHADNQTLRFVKQALNSAALSWLKNHALTAVMSDEFFLCHGSPARDDVYLLEEVREHSVLLKPTPVLVKALSETPQQIILCGHSHLPRTVHLPTGQLIINPGSVGLPAYTDKVPFPHAMETGTPHARYSILYRSYDGWCTANVAVPYDWQLAGTMALKNGRPDWAKWLKSGRA